jgi:hypothetical protein
LGIGCEVPTEPYILVELRLMGLSATIHEKPDWETKSTNPAILGKWRSEARHVTDDMFKFVVDELEYYRQLKDGPIEVLLERREEKSERGGKKERMRKVREGGGELLYLNLY